MRLHFSHRSAPLYGLSLRRHELPVGSSIHPDDECPDIVWPYVTTDLLGGTIDSVWNLSDHADPCASDSAGSTAPTTSVCIHFTPNEFDISNEYYAQCTDRSDPLRLPHPTSIPPTRTSSHLESPNSDRRPAVLLANIPTGGCSQCNSYRTSSIHTRTPKSTPYHCLSTNRRSHSNCTSSPHRTAPGPSPYTANDYLVAVSGSSTGHIPGRTNTHGHH